MAPKGSRNSSPKPALRPSKAAALSPVAAAKPEVPVKPAELESWKMSAFQAFLQTKILPLCLLLPCPVLVFVFTFLTNSPALSSPSITGLLEYGSVHGVGGTLADSFAYCGFGDKRSWLFLAVFNSLALVLYHVIGPTKYGPITPNGNRPEYMDNGIAHCVLFTSIFVICSAGFGWFDMGIFYDVFPKMMGAVNIFGLVWCLFLYIKGMYFPSTNDAGSSGHGFIFDYYWGAELYPRIFNVDVKKFINCRWSMTFWMLAGISYSYKSYTMHGKVDPGIVLSALSQFIYLNKFYIWEMGYMRSIDIIVDRAGFYVIWGCIAWVPSVYTLHTRILVRSPSGLSWPVALLIFAVGLAGVLLNFWADNQRMRFREESGKGLVWGKPAVFITAKYTALNKQTGRVESHESLLLASGWWGIARHFQYMLELTAAYSWGLLGGVMTNGFLPLFYPIFLTILLIHRAQRDEEKCLTKYGDDYRKYMKLVPYKMIPHVY